MQPIRINPSDITSDNPPVFGVARSVTIGGSIHNPIKNKAGFDRGMAAMLNASRRLAAERGTFRNSTTAPAAGCQCGNTDDCGECRGHYIDVCERLSHGQQRLGLLLYP